jgi:hypothetical protein
MLIQVDTAEVTYVVPVHNMSIGEDVGEGAFGSEFAVALCTLSEVNSRIPTRIECLTFVKYLQGARSASGSSECRNGQALPA